MATCVDLQGIFEIPREMRQVDFILLLYAHSRELREFRFWRRSLHEDHEYDRHTARTNILCLVIQKTHTVPLLK